MTANLVFWLYYAKKKACHKGEGVSRPIGDFFPSFHYLLQSCSVDAACFGDTVGLMHFQSKLLKSCEIFV